ncbi:MAG: hypothetical protein ACOYXT_28435 [Bacteroidota bacterium]
MRESFQFFSNLFGKEGGGGAQEEKEVTITSYSQPNVLREKMKEKQLSHGETVVVNMSPVRLEAMTESMILYFCPLQTLDVLGSVTPGDGADIPTAVTLEGVKVPFDLKAGMYTLKNVKLTSNGTMQVIATAETSWEACDIGRHDL